MHAGSSDGAVQAIGYGTAGGEKIAHGTPVFNKIQKGSQYAISCSCAKLHCMFRQLFRGMETSVDYQRRTITYFVKASSTCDWLAARHADMALS